MFGFSAKADDAIENFGRRRQHDDADAVIATQVARQAKSVLTGQVYIQNKVAPISEVASKLFHDRLFETSPHLAPMFYGVDLASQRQKLVKAINMVVVSLERIDTLIPTIHDLGRRHIAYGVEESHYTQVGSALLWTLATGLGDDWSDEAEAAWTNAYQLLAGVMIEGAREGRPNVA